MGLDLEKNQIGFGDVKYGSCGAEVLLIRQKKSDMKSKIFLIP